jgi:hypothetical protein
VSIDRPSIGMQGTARALRVQAIFKLSDERSAQTVAASMIDRAHEIANLPECECDVDVSVEWTSLDEAPEGLELGGAPVRGRPSER